MGRLSGAATPPRLVLARNQDYVHTTQPWSGGSLDIQVPTGGTNAWGSWVQLAVPTYEIAITGVQMRQNAAATGCVWAVQVGVGPAGAEIPVSEVNGPLTNSVSFYVPLPFAPLVLANQRLSLRAASWSHPGNSNFYAATQWALYPRERAL